MMNITAEWWLLVLLSMLIVWQCCWPRNSCVRLYALHGMLPVQAGVSSPVQAVDPMLVLSMITVALRSGVSIPRALDAVGSALFDKQQGQWLCDVSAALIRGDSWHEAFSPPHGVVVNKETEYTPAALLCRWLSSCLSDAWIYGSSPVGVLEATLHHYEQSVQNAAQQASARLAVKLLLPVGLCFLPSFICIGILPTVASMMAKGLG